MNKNITIKIVLQDNRNIDGLSSVALRIIKNRKKAEITLGVKCKSNEFENQEFNRTYPNYHYYNGLLAKAKVKAIHIIEDFEQEGYDFTFDDFKSKFLGTSKYQDTNIIKFIDEIILDLIKSGRTGNARAYSETKNALIKFGGSSLSFKSITTTFLEKFEVYLRENGNADGGIAFKMRELRAIFNKAIIRNIISIEGYPFKHYKISKLKPQKNKRALTIEEFRRIRDIDISDKPHLIDAYNYFMFSFYTRGINFVDMMKLKWSDIKSGRIYYIRSKTKGSFDIEIMDKTQTILDYYKNQKRTTSYVFPILLSDNLTPVQIEYRKKKVLQSYNSKLKEIALIAEVDKRLTSYVARHSFATILKKKGTSTDKISELMGHADVQITMTYLKDFDIEELDKENRKLLEL